MKTYGKESRKLSRWISPDNRKKAFDSSRSTDGDCSVFEPANPAKKRGRKTSVSSRGATRPAKRKAMLCLAEKSYDEENAPSPSRPQPARQRKTVSGHHLSAGRFVTRRKRAAATKLAKSAFDTLDSSDDFTSGVFGPKRVFRPRGRKALPAPLVSSAENSLNIAGAAGFSAKPFRETSLNESTDRSLGPCPRKPIFCSTPSAGSFSKGPRPKPLSNNDHSSSPPSMSVSCSRVLSTFKEDSDSPGPPASPPLSPQPIERLRSEETREPRPHPHEESSGYLLTEPKSSNKRRHSSEDDARTGNVGESSSLTLRPTDGGESGSSSRLVSAAGGMERLRESLKERCLSEGCAVQLEQLDKSVMSQLRGRRTADLLQSPEPSSRRGSSVSTIKALRRSGSVNRSEASQHAASVAGDHRANASPSAGDSPSQGAAEQSASVLYVDTFMVGARLPADGPMGSATRTPPAGAGQGERLPKKCTVQIHKLALARGGMFRNDSIDDTKDPDDVILLGEITEGGTLSSNHAGLVAQTRSDCPEASLKERCRSAKVLVEVRRVSSSQLRGIQQLKEETLESEKDANRRAAENRLSPRSGDGPGKENKKKETKPRRSTSADRPGTTRKACVSGLSVSRWKNHAGAHAFRSKAVDCSINDLIPTQHKRPQEWLGSAVGFSTPQKAGRLNLSSLLADLTPNTHTWSRLKAALSVHRRNKVLLTPSSSRPAMPRSSQQAYLTDLSQDLFSTPFRTPLPKRLRSGLLSSDSPVPCEDVDLSDAEKVCAECDQPRPLPWEECVLPHRMKRCVKIGEGTFGEVFSTTNASGDTVALKIIPLEGSEKVNGEDQKTFGEILHEIIISKELSSLKEKQRNKTHGFIGLNDLHCVQGSYPPDFLKAWDAFDQQKGSENDRPDFFNADQLFIILEFEFGGADLENSNGTLTSLTVAKSILHQVTAALAVAEQELHFEHRDLHWGNVLVKATTQKRGSFLLNGAAHSLETKGVLVRIIDYSLSRLEIDDLTVSCDISNDEELFMGRGDYQFDIYRLMRQENGNNWSNYNPHTNVLWLHYLCSKLLSMKYRGSGGRGFKATREELARFHGNVLQYSSATEALQTCPMFQ
ncbi:Serine/threonine-protein kinase haspin [Liparis tanakae]|uniref:Serine/threonine-protein kinase haspin n=1 Tax=Liparis tanakae TaxID=230148 RepID=A0A4Z2HUV7_9TELE|nr:Serine/threonine-protein kinase haspin [Liparis tanakae]